MEPCPFDNASTMEVGVCAGQKGGEASESDLEELLDDFSEEMRQCGRVSNGGVGSNGGRVAVALLAISADEGVEQQRQPIPGKVSQHLHIPAQQSEALNVLSDALSAEGTGADAQACCWLTVT